MTSPAITARLSPLPNKAHLIQWHEWGAPAFDEARQQDKPIALFITAFWCGICHRLDETSLSDDQVIALLNAFFVPVRIEEAQRPDVDLRYNQNGWPTIVFISPEGDDIFTTNSLSPREMIDTLVKVISHYQQEKGAIREAAQQALDEASRRAAEEPAPLSIEIVGEVAGMLEGLFDAQNGGFGDGDKLIHADAIDFLFDLYQMTGEQGYLNNALLTLDKMRASRMLDRERGGFFRYSSKPDWQQPHPEKLLNDQAALLDNYLRAYLLTDDPSYRKTAEQLIEYVFGTLADAETGLFFGCEDLVRPIPAHDQRERLSLMPMLDHCLYTDANAHLAKALLHSWLLLGNDGCRTTAEANIEWLWTNMHARDGIFHYWRNGRPILAGLLNDSVALADVLVEASALLQKPEHLARARELATSITTNHRNPKGGFYDICQPGPARLQFLVTSLTQNADAARFLIKLADSSGETVWRKEARFALQGFPNQHRVYGAFAAGFGTAVARLLSPCLRVEIEGRPGDASVRTLLRSALMAAQHPGVSVTFKPEETPNIRML